MEEYYIGNALGMYLQSFIPILICAFIGAVVIGLVQSFTHVEDRLFGFTGKLAGVLLALYIGNAVIINPILEFTRRFWSGADMYH